MATGRTSAKAAKAKGEVASKARRANPARKKAQLPFKHKLVLNQLLLKLFEVDSFARLAEGLKSEDLEGLDANHVHSLVSVLTTRTVDRARLPREVLLEYDANIVRHTQLINEHRLLAGQQPIVWKYFQYLMLVFTEIYLDWYFRDPEGLLAALNEEISTWNSDNNDSDKLELFDVTAEARTELNKLSFWCATGSGKTLIMHLNIHQFRYYQHKYKCSKHNGRIILLTPNEGLSRQHVEEFTKDGLKAELFAKDYAEGLRYHEIDVIDINKLAEESGDKTVAVQSFEGNNLVLVDEGHRGTSGGADGVWLKYRNALCEDGFSFEYSATFGQGVRGNKQLTNSYARNILFDYSYSYFYNDGFGKHYSILNLDEQVERQYLDTYLTACFLAYYQQVRLFRDHKKEIASFNIEKPLLVFVGSRVTKSLSATESSDIIRFLEFLARFVGNRATTIANIERVLSNGLVTADGKNLFAERFRYLHSLRLDSAAIYSDILGTVLNSTAGGAMHIEQRKNADGEIALRLGEGNDPFGVINVGDAAGLMNLLAEKREFVVMESTFGETLFHRINENDSPINVLIGSKKFMEGWNSWRVSTMGLMNVGKNEGTQVIQLFGRGVRLKGYNWTLKRSSKTETPPKPQYIDILETLNIFGIRADYMAQFKAYLEEEGLNVSDEQVEILLPVIKNLGKNLGERKLKTIRLKKEIAGVKTHAGAAYRAKGPIPTLQKPRPDIDREEEWLIRNRVVINWYPKIQFLRASALGQSERTGLDEGHLTREHIALLDLDNVFIELERFKAEKRWNNLNISRANLADILQDHNWYTLQIPRSELAFTSIDKIRLWNELAIALLKKYCERYYQFKQNAWELPHLEYQELTEEDINNQTYVAENGPGYYRCLVDESQQELIGKLRELKELIDSKQFVPWEYRGLKALWFERHLFQPLLYMKQNTVEIQPVPLNLGELQFVEDLSTTIDRNPGLIAGKELYLLRNLSRGKGVGFFEAGNFYPDFILWIVSGNEQRVCFIDPKGLGRMSVNDLKVQFYKKIKEIEQRLANPAVILESFIISNTPSCEIQNSWGLSKEDLRAHHVLFQEDRDGVSYIEELLMMAWDGTHGSDCKVVC